MHALTEIIQGCIKSEWASQKAFYQYFYGFSMGICMRYCTTKDEAMEVVNDGFLKVFRQLQIFDSRNNNPEVALKAWMKTIFINTAIDHFRKNKKHQFSLEISNTALDNPDKAASSIDSMTYKEIIAIVQKLSPAYRTVFCLHVIDGYKHEEISNLLNIAVNTSKSNLAKARINIQKMLNEADSCCYERKAV